MKKRVLESGIISWSTNGLAEICGPSEDRVSLILNQPSSGVISYAPKGMLPNTGSFITSVSSGPLVITYEQWGSIVKGAWDVDTFGTQRNGIAIEVIERWVELPGTVTEVQPQEQQGTSEQKGTVDQVSPLSSRARKKYRRSGILG